MPVFGFAMDAKDEEALRASGCQTIIPTLEMTLPKLRPGDTLVVTRPSRLGHSIADLQRIGRTLTSRKIVIKTTEQPLVDTSTPIGRRFFDLLDVFVELAADLRQQRQRKGIAAAKAKGVYKGRPATISASQVVRLKQFEGLSPSAIAEKLGIARASVYRILRDNSKAEAAKMAERQEREQRQQERQREQQRRFDETLSRVGKP
jgi:DNA invertase Pin-like site-specific DNA recombinase